MLYAVPGFALAFMLCGALAVAWFRWRRSARAYAERPGVHLADLQGLPRSWAPLLVLVQGLSDQEVEVPAEVAAEGFLGAGWRAHPTAIGSQPVIVLANGKEVRHIERNELRAWILSAKKRMETTQPMGNVVGMLLPACLMLSVLVGCGGASFWRHGQEVAGKIQEAADGAQKAETDALLKAGHFLCVGWTHRYTVEAQEVLKLRGKEAAGDASAPAELTKATALASSLEAVYEAYCALAKKTSLKLKGQALPEYKPPVPVAPSSPAAPASGSPPTTAPAQPPGGAGAGSAPAGPVPATTQPSQPTVTP